MAHVMAKMRQPRWDAAIVCVIVSAVYACATSGRDVDESALANNRRCYLCHLDFDGEPLVAGHEVHGIGCANCHGPSEAHMADEDHLTPPDTMFDRADVSEACTTCHGGHTEDEIAQSIAGGDIVCTDCHGNHAIKGREADTSWN